MNAPVWRCLVSLLAWVLWSEMTYMVPLDKPIEWALEAAADSKNECEALGQQWLDKRLAVVARVWWKSEKGAFFR